MPEQDWHDARLTHLQFLALYRWNVRVSCTCGRTAVFHGGALWWLFERNGWSDRLQDAPKRFTCEICRSGGRRGLPRLQKTRDEATRPLKMPDEREWKRLVSRYRA